MCFGVLDWRINCCLDCFPKLFQNGYLVNMEAMIIGLTPKSYINCVHHFILSMHNVGNNEAILLLHTKDLSGCAALKKHHVCILCST